MRTSVLVAAAFALAGCATSEPAPSGPPTVIAGPGQPAPPQARLYADCIAQAADAASYDREANLIRFRCTGAPAQAFYDGLAAYSAEIDSAIVAEGRTWRFTQKLERDPFGVDFCWRSAADEYGCTVVLNVGEFLAR